MKISVLAVGRKMPDWVTRGCVDFERRLPRELQIEWVDIAPGGRGSRDQNERAREQEGEKMLARLDDEAPVIALDERGLAISTLDLAASLNEWQMQAARPVFLIGGADGLAPACLDRAQQKWSLSALTFPHALVRILLVEQLYRAAMINANHPYHRA